MTTCQCESCRPKDPGKTWTKAWLMECEARAVLAMPFGKRGTYLKEVKTIRGAKAGEALKGEVERLWGQNKSR